MDFEYDGIVSEGKINRINDEDRLLRKISNQNLNLSSVKNSPKKFPLILIYKNIE